MTKCTPFEAYLEDVFNESAASDGILDDDLYDSFQDWLSSLDTEELIEYGNKAINELSE